MIAEHVEVWELLGISYQYTIPIYQRRYNWGEEQCMRLYDDILKIGKSDENRTHFIGAITYVSDAVPAHEDIRSYQIIDGQQRFTTLMLLLMALKNSLKTITAEKVTTEKIDQLLFNTTAKKESSDFYKLILTDSDDESFKQILNDIDPEESNNVVANFKYFKKQIINSHVNPDIIWKGIRRLSTVSIHIKKDGGDDPQEIFESMNSTGLELSNTDLIRNYILMKYDVKQQEKIYKQYWKDMEDKISDDGDLDEFLRNYLVMKKGIFISKKKIYAYFKNYTKEQDMMKIIREIHECSKQYKKLISGHHELDKISDVINYILSQKTTVAYPILLKVLVDHNNNKIGNDDVIKIFLLIDSYLLRCTICDTGMKAANRMFTELIPHIKYDKYVESIEQTIMAKTAANLRLPRNDVFKEKLLGFKLYSNKTICKYILARIEHENSKEKIDMENLQIEHIMPQKLNDSWKDNLGSDWEYVHEKFIHNIGNLTLTAYNSEISNSSFTEKKSWYKESRLKITQDICEYTKWNNKNIMKRGNILADKVIQIWKIPKEIDEKSLLDDDDMVEKEYLDGKEIKKLWYDLKAKILLSCPNTKFDMMKKYGAIKGYNKNNKSIGICGMAARINKIYLTYNCKIEDDIIKQSKFIENISNINHDYNGDLRSTIISIEDISRAIPYVIKIWNSKMP